MYRLLVADDHPLFREAMVAVISRGLSGSETLEAASLAAAIGVVAQHDDLDLALLDLGLPDAEGLSGLAQLRQAAPWLPVVIVSAEQHKQTILEALNLGAVGYIPKSTPRDALLAALQQVLAGQVYLPPDIMRGSQPGSAAPPPTPSQLASLTGKQREVLAHMVKGESNKMIAYRLDIAETTVKTHVSAILRKLRVSSRVQAILLASERDDAVR
ncbi:two component transcriptional regulator, LuxR family [Franzmannia pantelleriensis]|uniref:Two component transcriptional regulator, LuxR family n=1 Tax=Franzmannia pantelleriensis TaxID=48727 RepID=A0A1G9JF37_9GAMM|nr:response regulator transcription factor [Halomonas pantelleriensis]SDL35865.1 two component transcriptional regulator, LuxR family [Halomonas pantelleriensis]